MPQMPKLSSLEKLVKTLEDHPFGSVMLFLLAVAFVASVYVARH